MKILFVTMQFGRGYSQGTERYLSLLAAALEKLGHEAVFLAGDPERRGPNAALGEVVERSPRVFACPTTGWMTVRGMTADRYADLLAQQKPDLVHLANPGHIGVGVLEAAAQARMPTVVSVVDFWWLCPKHTLHHHTGGVCSGDVTPAQCLHCIAASHESGLLRSLAKLPAARSLALPLLMFGRARMRGLPAEELGFWRNRRAVTLNALNAADAVIFLSKTAKGLLESRLNSPSLHLIQNGLEARWFAPPRIAARPKPRSPEKLVIGYAGALAPHKGVHTLIDAIARLAWKHTTIRIAAAAESGSYAAALRRSARGLNVEFVGRVAGDAMPEFLDSLDVLTVPSLWPENVPMAVLEAFARGKSVIASSMPGIAELIDDPLLLFEPGSAADLASSLQNWLDRPEFPPVPTVRTAEQMAADTLHVYERIRAR